MRPLIVAAALLALAAFAAACGPQATPAASGPAVTVSEPWVRAAIQGGTGAAYMVLKNAGKEDMKLVSVAADLAQSVELHQTTMSGGMMQMSPVKDITVPAGGQTELKPGSYHVMLIGLKRELKAGEKLDLTLTFDKGAAMKVTANVKQQ